MNHELSLKRLLYKYLVDGSFGEWSDFSECSEKCGPGVQSRRRECNNPLPAFGGKVCIGEATQQRECKLRECPGMYS